MIMKKLKITWRLLDHAKKNIDYLAHTHNDNVDLDVIDGGHSPRRHNDLFTVSSQVS